RSAIRALADGSSLGFAALVRLDLETREGEIGYALPAAARGRGAATRAVGLLTGWGFSLGLERLDPRRRALRLPARRCSAVLVLQGGAALRSGCVVAARDGSVGFPA